MERETILEFLNSWNSWEHDTDVGLPRNYYVSRIVTLLVESQIPVVVETGIRRSGKSYIARQVARRLTESNYSSNRVLIINLEDERLIDRSYEALLEMYAVYKETINPAESSIIILDEPQEIDGWERFVRGLSERGEAKFLITGSSSKLLDSEYSTLLSGRHVVIYVHPLNLLEYMQFTGRTKGIADYLKDGSFPAVTLSSSKAGIINSYFDTIILKDVIQRFRIQKQTDLIRLAKFYITSVGSRITFNSVSRFLKLAIKTAYNFSFHLEKSYLVFFVDRFSFSVKVQNNSPRKVYSVDNSFPATLGLNAIEINGRLLENAVAATLFLISKNVPEFQFYYWAENGKEVDFVVKDRRNYEALQVAYSLKDEKTKTREISSLLECAAYLNLAEVVIVTMEYSSEEFINGVTVKFTPVSEWIEDKLNIYKLGST